MVFTLHRYIFRELIKVFILTVVALTLMMSLGMILRPVQEYGIGPQQVLHLMGYFLPITLTFVLPMAALFAAALVYGRFANDNELDACKASGVSLLTLVYPGLALAIMVATANLILSFHVMPAFVHRAEKSLKADAKQMFFRNIQRKGYYRLPPGRYLIYADRANPQNDTLSGIVAVKVKNDQIEEITTAESARIHFISHEKFNEVQITAHKPYQMGPEAGAQAELMSVTMEFPPLLSDDIKFKKIDDMKKIDGDPMHFYPIARLARQVKAQLIAELLAQDITGTITGDLKSNNIRLTTTDAAKGFYRLPGYPNFVEFTAAHCSAKNEKRVELSGEVMDANNIVVYEYDAATKQLLRTLASRRALLHIEGAESTAGLTMELYSPKWLRMDGSEGVEAGRHRIRGLLLPQSVKDKFATGNILSDINTASASLQNGPSEKLIEMQNGLQRKIHGTLAAIKAEIHSRLVFGTGCVSLIIIGVGLGIILKGGHLLSAFGVSSVPAAFLIVCIMMGKNITKNPDSQAGSGVVFMWAGLAFLSFLAVVIYRRLLKN